MYNNCLTLVYNLKMVFSQVSIEESLRVKKRMYVGNIDEYNGCSEPLNDVVLSTVLSVIPSKNSGKKLKPGYIVNLARDGGISPCSLILGLLYIKRLSMTCPAFFTTLSSRELFLVSMLVASKYLNDEGELEALTNTDFSTIGCMPRKRLDHLEVRFLEAIDWRLFVSMEEYYKFVTSVEGRVALNQACQQGWFSYTDLCAVWESSDVQDGMLSASKTTTKVVCGSALLYLVCAATLFASTPQPSTDPTPSLGNLDDPSVNLTLFEPNTPPLDPTSPFQTPHHLLGTSPNHLSGIPPDLPSLQHIPQKSLDTLYCKKSALEKAFVTSNDTKQYFSIDHSLKIGLYDSIRTSDKEDCARKLDSYGVDCSGGHFESGLFLLLNLTAALTSMDFLTPDSNCLSSSTEINPSLTILLSPDDYTRNKTELDVSFTTKNSTTNTLLGLNSYDVNYRINTERPDRNTHTSLHYGDPSFTQKHIPKGVSDTTGNSYGSQYFLDYDNRYRFTKRNNSPHPNDLQSPVVVMETVPMVITTPPWGYGLPVNVEKSTSNFTLMEALSVFTQIVLAW